MTPVPLELPLSAAEAVALGALIFEHTGSRRLTDDLRGRLAERAAGLRLESFVPYLGSLERDPVHERAFYLAADARQGAPLLLRIAAASAPASGLYPKSLLIARGRNLVVNASPFGPEDERNVRVFAEQVNRAFLPRPQGSQTAVLAAGGRPEAVLPGTFDAFRAVLKRTGRNMAALNAPYAAAQWAAIRAGWREGFTVETGAGPEAEYTKFRAELPRACEYYDAVRQVRRAFDFELVVDAAEAPRALEMFKTSGRLVRMVASEGLDPDVPRAYGAALTLTYKPGMTLPGGRVNLRVEFGPEDTRAAAEERIRAAAALY
ncbi:MAG: hypothetical protein ACE15B_06845 [Bryobacteraceae bacterium]